jgi:hypothetical protein
MRKGRYVGQKAHTSILKRQKWSTPSMFVKANFLAAAEVRRRGGTPDLDNAGRLRAVTSPDGVRKKVEVALVGPGQSAIFRNANPGQDVNVFIFTDCAGGFWLATADEVRQARS